MDGDRRARRLLDFAEDIVREVATPWRIRETAGGSAVDERLGDG